MRFALKKIDNQARIQNQNIKKRRRKRRGGKIQ